jgi:hypothetical protein
MSTRPGRPGPREITARPAPRRSATAATAARTPVRSDEDLLSPERTGCYGISTAARPARRNVGVRRLTWSALPDERGPPGQGAPAWRPGEVAPPRPGGRGHGVESFLGVERRAHGQRGRDRSGRRRSGPAGRENGDPPARYAVLVFEREAPLRGGQSVRVTPMDLEPSILSTSRTPSLVRGHGGPAPGYQRFLRRAAVRRLGPGHLISETVWQDPQELAASRACH